MSEPLGPERRTPRVELHKLVSIVDEAGTRWEGRILDLSNDGFRLTCVEPLIAGDHILIVDDHGVESRAEIKWAMGREAGGVFLDPPDMQLR